MSDIAKDIAAILTALVGLALFAVLVGKNSQTSSVVKAFGDAFASDLKAAVSPVS